MALPDFLIVGAMKCGTSTLHAQLAAQPGVFMAAPKEPNFFSDDAIFARGAGWYEELFAAAPPGALRGEASTHYTKLPTYPDTVARMRAVLKAPRLIYLLRNPVARAVSHLIHAWTLGEMSRDPARAFARHPELVEYGCYGRQIAPYVRAYGQDSILLVSLERMQNAPQAELTRVAGFLGLAEPPVWQVEHARANASAERIRRFPFHDTLIQHPVAAGLRRTLVPRALRNAVKRGLRMQTRPELPAPLMRKMEAVFAEDHAALQLMFPDEDLSTSYPFLRTGVPEDV